MLDATSVLKGIQLLFLLIAGWTASAAFATDNFVAWDLDRMALKDKDELSSDRSAMHGEIFYSEEEEFRFAPYAPEALFVIKHLIPTVNSEPVHVLEFSGGGRERNLDAQEAFTLALPFSPSPWISGVLSFDDLTLNRPLPEGVNRENALEYFRAAGGQDKVPFFELFSKDLRKLGPKIGLENSLDHTVIFDDNVDVTPPDQIRNILVVARPDVRDEDLIRPDRQTAETRPRRSELGARDPVQVARAKYRLARAVGIYELATEQVASGSFKNIPDALEEMQWDENGRFRAKELNAPEIYARGLKLLKRAYDDFLLYNPRRIHRRPGYFEVQPLVPREMDCGPRLTNVQAVLPWRG